METSYYITQSSRSSLEEVEYTVIIDDGAGSSVRERVTCSSTPCSYTYHPAEGSRREFGVSVETSGCVTREIVCTERPVCESTRNSPPPTLIWKPRPIHLPASALKMKSEIR